MRITDLVGKYVYRTLPTKVSGDRSYYKASSVIYVDSYDPSTHEVFIFSASSAKPSRLTRGSNNDMYDNAWEIYTYEPNDRMRYIIKNRIRYEKQLEDSFGVDKLFEGIEDLI